MVNDRRADDAVVSERRTVVGSALNGVGSVVSTGLGFLLVVIITRNYGADDAGVFFGVVALFAIIGTAAKLGTETALVYLISRFIERGAHRSIREAIRAALLPVIAVSVVGAVGLFVLAPTLGEVFSDDRAADFTDVLRAVAPFLPAWSIGLVLLGATRGLGTMVPTAVGLQLVQPIAQIGLVLVGVTADWELPTIGLAWAVPLVLTSVIALVAIMPHLRAGDDEPFDRGRVWRDVWRFAGPRGLAGTLQVSLDRVGILIIGALSTSTAAGQWAAISRLIGVAQRSFHAVGQALNPRVSALAQRQDWSAVAQVFERITVATVAALAPVVLALVIFPKSALDVFGGPEFETASGALVIAAAATLGAIAFAHVDNVLLMAGRSATALIDTALALGATLLLDLLLVPRYGLRGAAVAMAAGVLVYRGSAALQVKRWFGVQSVTAPVVKMLVLATSIVGVGLLGARLVAGDRLPVAVVAGLVSMAVFVGILVTRGRAMGFVFRFDAQDSGQERLPTPD